MREAHPLHLDLVAGCLINVAEDKEINSVTWKIVTITATLPQAYNRPILWYFKHDIEIIRYMHYSRQREK